jgi:hypothetical protein
MEFKEIPIHTEFCMDLNMVILNLHVTKYRS